MDEFADIYLFVAETELGEDNKEKVWDEKTLKLFTAKLDALRKLSAPYGYLLIESWKKECNIGRRNNQNFVSIPFYKLTHMLKYKCEEKGIVVDVKDESHTSKCSFFDDESVKHHERYVGKRNRGLFRTAKGYIVNADVNGGFNIMKKAVSNAFPKGRADGIEGAVGHPSRLAVTC